MQLRAVIVPPPDVLDATLAAAQHVRVGAEQPSEEEPRGGLLQRLGRRGVAQSKSPQVALSVVTSKEQFVRLTRFGNVAHDDLENLGVALGLAACDWPAPVVHVSGLVVDATAPIPVIKAELGGDTDALRAIFRGILEVAQSQRFYLDRRIFHPEFPVATIDLGSMVDDAAVRERLEIENEQLPGTEWQVTYLTLLRLSFGSETRVFEEVAVVPLGSFAG